jgi:hypothetical protein
MRPGEISAVVFNCEIGVQLLPGNRASLPGEHRANPLAGSAYWGVPIHQVIGVVGQIIPHQIAGRTPMFCTSIHSEK